MIAPAVFNFRFQRGTSGLLAGIGFVAKDGNGNVIPLTNCIVMMTAVSFDGRTNISKTTTDGSLTLDTNTNVVSWPSPTPAEVASIQIGNETTYHFIIAFPDGSTFNILKGLFVGVE